MGIMQLCCYDIPLPKCGDGDENVNRETEFQHSKSQNNYHANFR
jgi:hypothetical protein